MRVPFLTRVPTLWSVKKFIHFDVCVVVSHCQFYFVFPGRLMILNILLYVSCLFWLLFPIWKISLSKMFQFLVSLAVRNSKTNSFPLALCSITADCTYTLLSLVIPATACILGFSGNTVPPSFCYKCFFFHEFSFISFYSILV